MEPNATTSQVTLEDRVFALEMALLSIGGALLAPNGWGDDAQLHQEMYATVRRVLRQSAFMGVLETREARLAAREASGARAAADAALNSLHTQVTESGARVPQSPRESSESST